MSEDSLAEISARINKILEPCAPEMRVKVLRAAMALYGDNALAQSDAAVGTTVGNLPITASEQDFFQKKDPKSLVEKLAVAARYLELHGKHETYSKKEFREFFEAARESFDSSNYSHHMSNARAQGFFTRGNKRGVARLSANGQKFVDALPDRVAALGLKAPKKATKKRRKKQ